MFFVTYPCLRFKLILFRKRGLWTINISDAKTWLLRRLLMSWFLRRSTISSHGIGNGAQRGTHLPRGRLSTTCAISVWMSAVKCKYIFIFFRQIFFRRRVVNNCLNFEIHEAVGNNLTELIWWSQKWNSLARRQDTHRHTQTQTHTHTYTDTVTNTNTGTDTDTNTDAHTHIHKHRYRHKQTNIQTQNYTDTHTDTDRQTQTHTDTGTDTQTETETHTDTNIDTHTEKDIYILNNIYTGLILGFLSTNEIRCYFVTTSLIGWAQA